MEREKAREKIERQALVKSLQRCMRVLDRSLIHLANAELLEGGKAIAFESLSPILGVRAGRENRL